MISAVVLLPSGHSHHQNKNPQQMLRKNTIMITRAVLPLAIALLLTIACPLAGAATTVTSGKTISTPPHSNWAQNEPARFYITKYESTTQYNHHKFIGNHSDYFKILHQDTDTILVGGKNALYNLSIATLQEQPNTRIEWLATDAHRQLCVLKGKHESECQNFIRVYAKTAENQFLLCGTNAYKPQCREYNTQRVGKQLQPSGENEEEEDANAEETEDTSQGVADYDNEEEAQGRCPYNPQHSSSYVFAGKNPILRGAPTLYMNTQGRSYSQALLCPVLCRSARCKGASPFLASSLVLLRADFLYV